jgi:CheY-like chemotaxis protein
MSAFKYDTVLLIDDNLIDNMINQKILSSSGFAKNVQVKQSCEDAINYLNGLINNQINFPEIIFLDIRMPIKSGFDFLIEYKELNYLQKDDVKIVMLSSSLDPQDHKKIMEFNIVSDFFGKPLTSELLKGI